MSANIASIESSLVLPIQAIVALFFVSAIAWVDWKRQRIPNRWVLAGTIVGLATQLVVAGASGLTSAMGGIALGMALLLPFYVVGAMGAGDVKLMGMVGACLGVAGVLSAAVLTFLAGGVLALLVALRNRSLGRAVGNIRTMLYGSLVGASATRRVEIVGPAVSAGKVPYGVAIAAGTLMHVVLLQLGLSIV